MKTSFVIRRIGAFAIAILLLVSAALFAGCGKKQNGNTARTVTVENGRTFYQDDYVRIDLPDGYFVAVDNTESMGNAYHAYLMFKQESDFTGSQIVYYSMLMKATVYENMQTSREDVEAQLLKNFKDRPVEITGFRNITQENCKGYIVEYKTSASGHDITQIIVNAVASSGKFVNFTFNCADDSLLESMRAAADSITLNN